MSNNPQIPGADFPLATPGATDTVLGVDESSRALRRFRRDSFPLSAADQARLQALEAGQSSDMLGFATKALMDASIAHSANTLAVVTNDPVAANNGTYIKLGASGTGTWQLAADRVTGLEARVSGLETHADVAEVGLEKLYSVEAFGRTGSPIAGTGATNAVYVFSSPAQHSGAIRRVVGYNPRGSAGTIKIKVFSRSGDTFTQVGNDAVVAVPAGAYTVDALIPVAAGQYVGVHPGGTAGNGSDACIGYTGGSGTSFYSNGVNANVATFTDATIDSSARLEIRLESDYVSITEPRIADVERDAAVGASLFEEMKASLTVGRAGSPVTGSVLVSTTFVFASPVSKSGRIAKVRGYNPQSTAGTVYGKVFTLSGNTFTQVGPDIPIAVPAGAFDVALDVPISEGQHVGFWAGGVSSGDTANNRVAYTANVPGDSGGYYNSPTSGSVATFTRGTLNTTNRLEIGFDIEYAAVPTRRSTVVRALANATRARAVAARSANLRSRPVMSSPPTVTVSAAAPNTGTYPQFPAAVSNAASYAPYLAATGGWLGYNGGNIFPLSVTRSIGSPTGGGSGPSYQTSHRIVWYTTAAVHHFKFVQSQLTKFRLIVDGQYANLPGWNATAENTTNYVTIDFGSRSPRGRRIELEIQGGPDTAGGSNGLVQFGGWFLSPLDTVWAPSRSELGPKVGFFGDSITFGPVVGHVATTMLGDGFCRTAADLLGLDDVWQSGLSGTGWLSQAGGTFPNIRDRISDLVDNSFDAIAIFMGINDAFREGQTQGGVVISTASIQQRVTEDLTTIRAARPDMPIVVFGPWRAPGLAGIIGGYETAIANGVAALNDEMIEFVPTVSSSWQTGTGKESATAGDGNSDLYICADGTHPTLDGHAYLAGRVAARFQAAIESILARVT